MRTFLLWPRPAPLRRELEPERVAARLQKIFAELFSTTPEITIRHSSAVNLLLLQLPISGWAAPFFEETDEAWAMAIDYPVDARAVMAAQTIELREQQGTLLRLARELEVNTHALLRQLSPPFSLIWSAKERAEIFLQNDGLGQSQLFEYRHGDSWAITNRLSALKALGITLEPDAAEWATRMILGWFPLQTTGFKRISYLEPATQLRIDAHGVVNRTVNDVLGQWLTHTSLSLDDCLELARTSLLKHIEAVAPNWKNPTVGLTGGYDSRAVVASLRKLDIDFQAFVKGSAESNDVKIASQLANIAGINLSRRSAAELPAANVADWKRSIHLSLLWQSGFLDTEKYKSDFASAQRLNPGVVRIMGQHGEIGRRYFHPRSEAELAALDSGISAHQLENIVADRLMKRRPSFIRKDLSEQARDYFIQAFRQADKYQLSNSARLDFFYLYERTRRLNSGSLSAQTNLVITPFLNPDYLRAVFAADGYRRDPQLFHKHIIRSNAPDWAEVPYDAELLKEQHLRQAKDAGDSSKRETTSKVEHNKYRGSRYYDSFQYWQAIGQPIIIEALRSDGFWQEVCDAQLARQDWINAPDELAILYLLPGVLS